MRAMPDAGVPEPSAVLVVRAWVHGSPPRIAARVTYTPDVTQPERVTRTVAGADAIGAVVQGWLDELGRPRPPVTDP